MGTFLFFFIVLCFVALVLLYDEIAERRANRRKRAQEARSRRYAQIPTDYRRGH